MYNRSSLLILAGDVQRYFAGSVRLRPIVAQAVPKELDICEFLVSFPSTNREPSSI